MVSFSRIVCGLAEVMHNLTIAGPIGRNEKLKRGVTSIVNGIQVLEDRLPTWVNFISDKTLSIPVGKCVASEYENFMAILNFLGQTKRFGMHTTTLTYPGLGHKLPHSIVSLATICLSRSKVLPWVSACNLKVLEDLLHETIPTTSTYNDLVTSVFYSQSPSAASSSSLKAFKMGMQTQASALRIHNFLILEASLWACALRCVEHTEREGKLIFSHSSRDAEGLRTELIGLVDDAERRCFGVGSGFTGEQKLVEPHLSPKNGSFILTRVQCSSGTEGINGDLDRKWEWEEFVGCWVRKRDLSSSATKTKRNALKVVRQLFFAKYGRAHRRKIPQGLDEAARLWGGFSAPQ